MSEELKRDEQLKEKQDTQIEEKITKDENATKEDERKNDKFSGFKSNLAKPKLSRKKRIIICAVIILAIIVIIASAGGSKFDRVQDKAVNIAGGISGGDGYFTIDTYWEDALYHAPDRQKKALEAIKYVNEELGFSGAVYQRMLETSAIMGRQSEENDKYRVSWTYHPDNGLEVTYEKK